MSIEVAKEKLSKITNVALVALYNTTTGKTVKKFSSRKAGEAQTLKALEKSEGALEKFAASDVSAQEAAPASSPKKSAKKPKTPKAKKPKTPKVAKSAADRSKAIAATWNDPKVKKARSKKDRVTSDGKEYRSLSTAFKELRVPMDGFLGLRKQFKADGKLTHEGHTFKVAAA